MKMIAAGKYRNDTYLIYKNLNWWYVYQNNYSHDYKYDNYISMHPTLKAALKSLNLKVER